MSSHAAFGLPDALADVSAGICAVISISLVEFFLSISADGEEPGWVPLPKSNAVPGVLGVLAETPKDAKAPEPRPNADDAPGDTTLPVFNSAAPCGNVDRLGVVGSRFREGKSRLWL